MENTIRQNAYDFVFNFNRNTVCLVYRLQDSELVVETRQFSLPRQHLVPLLEMTPLGMTPFEFRQDLWRQKTRFQYWLLRSDICAIPCSAFLYDTIRDAILTCARKPT